MSDFKAPPREKTAFDNRKLNLTTEVPGDSRKKSSLVVQLVANNPRLVVYTNLPDDQSESNNYGRINANMDAPTFAVMIEAIERMADAQPGEKISLNCLNHTFYGGKRSDAPKLLSTIYIGKDSDGNVYISVVSKEKERPIIKFIFGENDYHFLGKTDGTKFTKAEASVIYAKGWSRLLMSMMETMLINNYKEPEKKNDGGKGGWKGRDNNSSGGGNNNSFDNDLPF